MKKVISLFLSIVMLLSITAGVDFSAQAANYYDSIYPSEDFMERCIDEEYGQYYSCSELDDIKLPFELIHYAGNYEYYYIYVYDEDGRILADCIDLFPRSTTDITDLTLHWTDCPGPGTYYLECYSTYNTSGMDVFWSFMVTDHIEDTVITRATQNENGEIFTFCEECGESLSTTIIPKISSVTLSKISYVYDGKAKKPSVTVKDSKGKKIDAKNYTVKYSDNKNVGKATVTVIFKGNYSGTIKKTFTIKPKSTSISKLTAGKKKFTVKWKKQSAQTTGYQIQYSTTSNFNSAKTVTVNKNKTTSKSVSNLKGKKKYYVRIRTYKTVNGSKIYSDWSKVKSVTTKK